jgi:nucleotide-binding universal stress UspA family protein
MMKNILLCIDFHESNRLIDIAIEWMKPLKAKLWLIHAAAPDPDFVGYEPGPQYVRDNRARELKNEHQELTKLVRIVKEKGVDAEALLIQGPTIEIIIAESKKLHIDLIITGHHEHGFFFKIFNSDTASKLISKSSIPVLVIPLDD